MTSVSLLFLMAAILYYSNVKEFKNKILQQNNFKVFNKQTWNKTNKKILYHKEESEIAKIQFSKCKISYDKIWNVEFE